MVAKSTQVALLRRINKFAFAKRHEVEMLNALVIVGQHAPSKLRLIDDLSDVLEDEVAGSKVVVRS